jgi:hypothetical protein
MMTVNLNEIERKQDANPQTISIQFAATKTEVGFAPKHTDA